MRKTAISLVAVLGCIGFGSVARASTYHLSGPLVQRQGTSGSDTGYRGPRFEVTRWGSSTDTYVCPSGTSVSNWTVVAALKDSVGRSYAPFSYGDRGTEPTNEITIHVTNWSLAATVDLSAVISCTNAPAEFPYPPLPIPGCHTRPGRNCIPPIPPGEYEPYWDGQFQGHTPGAPQYAELVKRAFCWSSTYPGCAANASASSTEQFAVRDGTDTIATRFADSSLTLPPAVRLAEPAGCTTQNGNVISENRTGYLRLRLSCRRLRRGSTARVRIAKPVTRSFRLHNGSGSIDVRLAKPADTVEPLVHLGYGPVDTPCRGVQDRLRMHSRTFDLRVRARCGRAAGNTMAHLAVGGLVG
jgi:hypothetical protein